jgi:hypothetical protein
MVISGCSHHDIFIEVERLFTTHYPASAYRIIEHHYHLIDDLFQGRYQGYRNCNTEYHDFSHSIDTFLAVMRFVDGYNLTNAPFGQQTASRLLSSALFHDTGYIQRDWDTFGTGAKYTREHVLRSKEFVRENRSILELSAEAVEEINHYIDSTGLTPNVRTDTEAPARDQMASALLGAADIVAQMADRMYLEKLLFLYYEFREAGIHGYETEFDIIRKTVEFYRAARDRLETEYMGVHHCAIAHFKNSFGIENDLYIEAIERNINYVHKIMEDSGSNFRAKLHRMTV